MALTIWLLLAAVAVELAMAVVAVLAVCYQALA